MDRWKKATLLVSSCFLVVLNCANPVDKDPLKWRSVTEIPVTKDSFVIGEKMPKLLRDVNKDSMISILNYDSAFYKDPAKLVVDTTTGDTLLFSAKTRDSLEFKTHQDTIGEKLFHAPFGSIPISGASDIDQAAPLPASAGAFNVTVPLTINQVYYIQFAAKSQLHVKLTNSSTLTLNNISIGINSIGTVQVGDIAAGETADAMFDAGGKSIGHTVSVTLSGSGAAGAKSIGLKFSLNGLEVDSAIVDDHLVTFDKEFTNKYELTDTVAIDYIDIEDGFFQYQLTNSTGLPLQVDETHYHLWMTNGVINRKTISDLSSTSASDSLKYYSGDLTGGSGVIVGPHTIQDVVKHNISRNRLFTEWDPDKKKTITKVKYEIRNAPHTGDTVTISSNDSLVFSIKPVSFRYGKFEGTVMADYIRKSDTQKVAINLPFGQSAKDSLRGNMILQKVRGDVHVDTKMQDGSNMDSVLIDFVAFPQDSPQVKDSSRQSFTNVKNGGVYIKSLNITDVTNCFPDTICIYSVMHVPTGTRITAVNDLNDPDLDNLGKMVVNTNELYRLDAGLDYQVKAPVLIDLGGSRFTLPQAMIYFRKMSDRTAIFNMDIKNSSNLNMKLYALVAPKDKRNTLDSMHDYDVAKLISTQGAAEQNGYVNLLGANGVRIPPRDSSIHDSVVLNDQQLTTILNSDSCFWRWQIRFMAQNRDALRDTDFIRINSWFHLDGINNTDSLLKW